MYKMIRLLTLAGILFFGTPHRGSNLATFAEVFIRIPKKIVIRTESSPFLESLSKGAEYLEKLNEDFKRHHEIRPYEIVSFYETRPLKGFWYLVRSLERDDKTLSADYSIRQSRRSLLC